MLYLRCLQGSCTHIRIKKKLKYLSDAYRRDFLDNHWNFTHHKKSYKNGVFWGCTCDNKLKLALVSSCNKWIQVVNLIFHFCRCKKKISWSVKHIGVAVVSDANLIVSTIAITGLGASANFEHILGSQRHTENPIQHLRWSV